MFGLLRSHGEVLRAFNELGVTFGNVGGHEHGAKTPLPNPQRKPVHARDYITEGTGDGTVYDISGTTPRGGALAVGLQNQNERTLLTFLTSGCATYRNFWEAFRNDAALPRSVGRSIDLSS